MAETAEWRSARLFLVECYLPGADPDEVVAALRRVLAEGRGTAELTCCLTVPGDDNYFCLFTGDGPEELGTTFDRAGVPFERIVEARRVAHAPALPHQGGRCAVHRV
ncbi:hypothetical protein [Saccharothrix xinjiangensis]|uniref:DUF4242 domain-containing protein n=1 Tax=Saccharothrix xinjiangensis TaxID=204798 RepID=A0ABV9YCR4_9PSEU